MRKLIVVSGMLVALCLATACTYAAYDQAMGAVKSVDVEGNKVVVAVWAGRDAEPKETTFLVDKDTTIRINKEVKALADLKADMRVSVTFKVAEKGDATAILINVMQMGRGGMGGGGNRGGAGAAN